MKITFSFILVNFHDVQNESAWPNFEKEGFMSQQIDFNKINVKHHVYLCFYSK